MKLAACNLSIIPLRSEASHRSEMVSQVLFGEYFEILKEQEDFVQIKMIDNGYEGWIQRHQFDIVSQGYVDNHLIVNTEGAVAKSGVKHIHLLHGTKIFNRKIVLGDEAYEIEGQLRIPSLDDFALKFPKLISYYTNSPYLWGGRSRHGIDCSGFSQVVYRHFGLDLPRDAWQQAEKGEVVNFCSEIMPGDLAFFDNTSGRITHVGIMIDHETIIHASARIRIDKMDSEGIFNGDLKKYTHKLRIVKRYF